MKDPNERAQRVEPRRLGEAKGRAGPDPRSRRFSAKVRERVVEAARERPWREVAEEFGCSRESIRRWMKREGVSERQRTEDERLGRHDGYHRHWREVLRLWKERPGLGPAQIQNQLKRAGIRIAIGTVRGILEENGYTPPKAVVKEKTVRRFEAVRPLEMVHLDFKHFFINRFKAHLLLLQDDYSRFLCGYRLCESEDMQRVIEAVTECINRYGKMQSIVTDAGSAFYSWNGLNRFQLLLADEYGIDQIKATSPRTNGKIENVNKQIEKELLGRKYFGSIVEANEAIGDWVRFYNFERTHLGLAAGTVPADRFLPGWNAGPSPSESRPAEPVSPVWEEILRIALKKVA